MSQRWMIPLWVQVWGLRILVVAGIVLLGVLAGSGAPALALSLVWGPNGLFLWAFMQGSLRLPRFLRPVSDWEPVLYRWVGVGFVKQIVATRLWPLMCGMDPPPELKNTPESLDLGELRTMGAEVCHGATFLLMFPVALYFLAYQRYSEVGWILGFNVLLNGYPVLLQRANRWRIQRVRAKAHERDLNRDQWSAH